jgi:hypothetical protein
VLDGNQDTDCAIPDDLDRIDVGSYVNGAYQLNGLIRDVRIYDSNRRLKPEGDPI